MELLGELLGIFKEGEMPEETPLLTFPEWYEVKGMDDAASE